MSTEGPSSTSSSSTSSSDQIGLIAGVTVPLVAALLGLIVAALSVYILCWYIFLAFCCILLHQSLK